MYFDESYEKLKSVERVDSEKKDWVTLIRYIYKTYVEKRLVIVS